MTRPDSTPQNPEDTTATVVARVVAIATGIGTDLEAAGEIAPGTTARLLRRSARLVTPSSTWPMAVRTHDVPEAEL